jgi:ATP-binding cassette subfamily B protein
VRINGDDIATLPAEELNRMISVMFQDFVLYYLSAGKNIWFGDVKKPYQEEALRKAARQSGADDLISGFSKGYETPLGRVMEGGRQLSMGEWQKVAMARTFYKDAPLLILDEPGSSLDAKAEALLMGRMDELTHGKTSLIISHRLSATRKTNGILVLEKGKLVESGTHEELMSANGLYAGMFRLQAAGYF